MAQRFSWSRVLWRTLIALVGVGLLLVLIVVVVGRSTKDVARPCRADEFFVDTPSFGPAVFGGRDSVIKGSVAAYLTSWAQSLPANVWRCGNAPCPSITASIENVLERRPAPAWRTDAHERFYRVRFKHLNEIAALDSGYWCVAVDKIRSAFIEFVQPCSSGRDCFYVGRECDASALTWIEDNASTEMKTWHRAALGLDMLGEATTSTSVTIALLDSAEYDLSKTSNTTFSYGLVELGKGDRGAPTPLPTFCRSSNTDKPPKTHPHGSWMAHLITTIAPHVHLHNVEVLNANAQSTSTVLARGIDCTLFNEDLPRPIIFNMSLGFPPQLAQRSELRGEVNGSVCKTIEDPFGEPIRFLLAAMHEDAATGDAIAITATGNQPLAVPDALFPSLTPVIEPACGMAEITQPPRGWFFPAQLQNLKTCGGWPGSTHLPRRGAVGVSITDDRELRSPVIAGSESFLVAPGQHVYVERSCGEEAKICTEAITGTSVGAAIVSASVARLIADHPQLDLRSALQLLYLTGRSVCRHSSGRPIRRVDLVRAKAAVTTCPALLTCSAVVDVPSVWTLHQCWDELLDCGLETAANPTLASCAPASGNIWPATTLASIPSPIVIEPSASIVGPIDTASCGGSCVIDQLTPRAVLGSTGPTPMRDGCTDCELIIDGAQAQLVLLFDTKLNTMTFTNPILLIEGPEGDTMKKWYVELSTYTTGTAWHGGDKVKINEVSLAGIAPDWTKTTAALITDVFMPGAVTGSDVSALRLSPPE